MSIALGTKCWKCKLHTIPKNVPSKRAPKVLSILGARFDAKDASWSATQSVLRLWNIKGSREEEVAMSEVASMDRCLTLV